MRRRRRLCDTCALQASLEGVPVAVLYNKSDLPTAVPEDKLRRMVRRCTNICEYIESTWFMHNLFFSVVLIIPPLPRDESVNPEQSTRISPSTRLMFWQRGLDQFSRAPRRLSSSVICYSCRHALYQWKPDSAQKYRSRRNAHKSDHRGAAA